MSRHRNVRSMNYEDEYYDDEDDYSRSLEDNYCISPGTAAQFTWNRERNINFASYMGVEDVINEVEVEEDEELEGSSLQDSLNASQARLNLSDTDQARLNSCLEEIHTILGETVPESVIVDVVLRNQFIVESSLNELLTQQDTPKPRREPRTRKDRSQASTVENPVSEIRSTTTTQPNAYNTPSTVFNNGGGASAVPKILPTESQPVIPKAIVTPSKSAVKVTVGFHEEPDDHSTPSQTAASSSKKSGLKLKIVNNVKNSPSSSPKSSRKNAKSSSNASSRSSSTNRQGEENIDFDENQSMKVDKNLRSAVEFMGLEGDNEVIQATVESIKPMPATPKSKSKASKIDVLAEYNSRHGDKELLNLVVIGHVDAGKSTLMGHLLYQLGSVHQKTMHKYEQESKKLGKSSFAFAWVLDETEEERSRGVTMDVAQTRFETEKKIVTLLDAPGHKDFIPNMITGTSQADVAILVINATRGEFETGFEAGGQTREHSLLARSLGVGQLIVAVNKMDTIDWSQERYELITQKLGQFLTKQARFKESDVVFVPCSGLSGENLVRKSTEKTLTSWYKPAITLLERIDRLEPPSRPIDKPFRLNVSDVFKGVGVGFNVSGRVGSGYVQPGDKVLHLPVGTSVGIKNVMIDDIPVQVAFAGDHVNMTLHGVDMATVNIGNALCDPASPSKVAKRIRAKVVIFNIDIPITKGLPVVFHYQSVNEPALIKRLVSQLNKSTGEVVKHKPRCLVKNSSAVLELEFERTMCLELYSEFKDLGRFMLRQGGHTIAAGLIEEILPNKAATNGPG